MLFSITVKFAEKVEVDEDATEIMSKCVSEVLNIDDYFCAYEAVVGMLYAEGRVE